MGDEWALRLSHSCSTNFDEDQAPDAKPRDGGYEMMNTSTKPFSRSGPAQPFPLPKRLAPTLAALETHWTKLAGLFLDEIAPQAPFDYLNAQSSATV